jgi:hypothetical protein
MDDVIESKHDLSGRRSRCDLVSVGTKGRHGPRCGRAQLLVFGAMGSSLRRHTIIPLRGLTLGLVNLRTLPVPSLAAFSTPPWHTTLTITTIVTLRLVPPQRITPPIHPRNKYSETTKQKRPVTAKKSWKTSRNHRKSSTNS